MTNHFRVLTHITSIVVFHLHVINHENDKMPSISVVAPIFLQWAMCDDEFIRGNPFKFFNNLFDAHGMIKQVIIEFQVGPSKPLHDLFDSIFTRLE